MDYAVIFGLNDHFDMLILAYTNTKEAPMDQDVWYLVPYEVKIFRFYLVHGV